MFGGLLVASFGKEALVMTFKGDGAGGDDAVVETGDELAEEETAAVAGGEVDLFARNILPIGEEGRSKRFVKARKNADVGAEDGLDLTDDLLAGEGAPVLLKRGRYEILLAAHCLHSVACVVAHSVSGYPG